MRKPTPHSFQLLEKFLPDGEQIELNDTHVQIYHPKTNTVKSDDLGKKYHGLVEEVMLIGLGRNLEGPVRRLPGEPGRVGNGRRPAATRLILIPKDPQLAQTFPKFEVWYSDATGIAVQQKWYRKGLCRLLLSRPIRHMKIGPVTEEQVKLDRSKRRPQRAFVPASGFYLQGSMKTKSSLHRLQYLDWVRGLGALIMLQGHVFDSYLKPELRSGGAFTFSQFVGGMPPAMFLFLTGVTLAFLMDSCERKGMAPRGRVTTALRRSGYLFGLAFAFRAFEWVAGLPVSTGADFLRVDILNCMGFSVAALSVMAIFRTAERARLCAVLGLAIALLSP